ncbi:unnamed protein product [Cylicocyclus nassatus]|uniref:Uncharacterized protein n=1 Tax=Cylicocyclus nassatus TaxID=53992 RepID=A0AA36M9R0_CYLNA|nr:unnamed protein product [Cylicocyclus nassatus]
MRAIRQFVVVYKVTALLELLSERPVDQMGLRSLSRLGERLFEVATGAFNGASGGYIINYSEFRISTQTGSSFRFACSNEVCRSRHILYEHHLNRAVVLKYPRALLLDFSPVGTTSAAMAIGQVWLMLPLLPQAILHPIRDFGVQVNLKMRDEYNNEQKRFISGTTTPNDAVYPCIIRFYNDMKQALAQLVNKPYEFNNIDLPALDKHIILDIIEFNGDFENGFVNYVPTNANFYNRGCPNYFIMEANTLDPNLRQKQILDSTEAFSQFCNIADLKDSMIRFYNTIPASVQRFSKWESNFREHSDSLSFYRTLLQYSKELCPG